MPKHRWIAWLTAAAVLVIGGQAEARSYPPLFGAKEIGSANWTFKKGVVPEWRAMLGRWHDGAPCETKICTRQALGGAGRAGEGRGDPMAQIKTANSLLNKKPYIEDMNNWGKNEFWATSYEYMKKSGDCEDYSIAKYMLLKEAGIPVENMRIFSVRVRSLAASAHAILVVYQDNKAWVLDNRTPSVMDASLIKLEFQPVMSLNELQWLVSPAGEVKASFGSSLDLMSWRNVQDITGLSAQDPARDARRRYTLKPLVRTSPGSAARSADASAAAARFPRRCGRIAHRPAGCAPSARGRRSSAVRAAAVAHPCDRAGPLRPGRIRRFREIVDGTSPLFATNGCGDVAVAGQHDDAAILTRLADLRHHVEAAAVGEPEIDHA